MNPQRLAWKIQGVREEYDEYMKRPMIDGIDSVIDLVAPIFGICDREVFLVLAADSQMRVIGVHQVAVGALDSCIVSPREVMKFLILANASRFVCAHNHPSGTINLSYMDRDCMEKLQGAGKLMCIPLEDFVIYGDRKAVYSARKGGELG